MPTPGSVAMLTTREFCARIADPDEFSGGGAVAALTAAAAASTALLVLRLAERRGRSQAGAATGRLSDLVEHFLRAADQDLVVLQHLLAAQRALRAGGPRGPYSAALQAAAEEPLRLVDDVAELLDIVRAGMNFASRFTVSDLGAAAALAEGAAQAALLTVAVNVEMLRKEPEMERLADDLHQRATALDATVTRLAKDIVTATRDRIAGL